MLEVLPKEPILVVEDEPDLRDALTWVLRQEGYAVSAAANGREALDWLRGSSSPWLILLDLRMPLMDGFEFRVRQLQEPNLAAIPVVVLSAYGDVLETAGCSPGEGLGLSFAPGAPNPRGALPVNSGRVTFGGRSA